MSEIICHASLLKKDDCRLKGLPISNGTCIMCDLYYVEDILHIMSFYQKERAQMYEEIYRKSPKAKNILEKKRENTLYYLLGCRIPSLGEEEMIAFWRISGNMICKMYRKAITNRMGVG